MKAHQAQFTRPERRQIQYVVVGSSRFAPQTVSDQDAQASYDKNAAEYEQPRQVHAAHILVRVPPVGGSEAENKAKARIEDVLERARAGEDFTKLAKETSEDTANAPQGGDLGFVKPGDLVPQFEQAAFALKKGELAPAPVRTPFGYHAIKVLDVKEGGQTPFKDVADKIKAKLAAERAEAEARDQGGGRSRRTLLARQGFRRRGAHGLGLDAREATVGARRARRRYRPGSQGSRRRSSPLSIGRHRPRRSRLPTGYAIVKVVGAVSRPGCRRSAEIKARVIDAIKRERAEAIAMERAKALVASLAKGGDFVAMAKADGFATGETPLFSRAEPPKEAQAPRRRCSWRRSRRRPGRCPSP